MDKPTLRDKHHYHDVTRRYTDVIFSYLEYGKTTNDGDIVANLCRN
jgi:hypothetical protein